MNSKVTPAKSTRDIALEARDSIRQHVTECTVETRYTHEAIDRLSNTVNRLVWGIIVAACTLAGDLLIHALH